MGIGWRKARKALGRSVCASFPPEIDDLDSGGPRIESSHGRPVSSAGSNSQPVNYPRPDSQSPVLQNREIAESPETVSKNLLPSLLRLNLSRNGIRAQKGCCAICLETVKPGDGHAIFTAECSHSFHFPCIVSNVRHGSLICPVCRAKWKEVPWEIPVNRNLRNRRPDNIDIDEEAALRAAAEDLRRLNPAPGALVNSISSFRLYRQSLTQEPAVYDDDEPLDSISRSGENEGQTSSQPDDDEEFEFKDSVVDPEETSDGDAGNVRKMRIALLPEVEAVTAIEASENFTVLVHVKAPSASEASKIQNQENCERNMVRDPGCRVPIDLVTVLDVSRSMSGLKLSLLKRAMAFVISNLSPADRLSVVVFSSTAKRVFPLKRMGPDGQAEANQVVERLLCSGGTHIAEGLRKGAKVLEERRQRNPVASIMLLSDGQDTSNSNNSSRRLARQSMRHGHLRIPVHTFGFGVDHDAATMHGISEDTGGTFSFIQTEGLVQDSFAQCIGGLLSVVVQDISVTIGACTGTKLKSINAGSYETCVAEDGSQGMVNLGDLYAEEERDVLVEFKLPAVSSSSNPMNLISVRCSYKDPVSQRNFNSREHSLSILRPESTDGSPVVRNLEVEKQRTRLKTAQAIAEAKTLADRGEMSDAQEVLENAKIELQLTRTGDHSLSLALEAEITEIQARMTNKETYERSGRAFVLSAQSSHFRQRATTRGENFENYSREYQTPSMANMVLRSQTLSSTALPGPVSNSTASSSSICAR